MATSRRHGWRRCRGASCRSVVLLLRWIRRWRGWSKRGSAARTRNSDGGNRWCPSTSSSGHDFL
jgi:hypothetical protein